ETVHRTGGAADRRRPHVPRRGAAAVLRCHAGGRRAAHVPRPVPAARGAGGVAPRREPRGPGAAGAGARAVPPRAGGLSHAVWLLLAGMFASHLKGLDFEEAILLTLVLGV